MNPENALHKASTTAAKSGRQAAVNPAVKNLERAGYVARGVIYVLIGILAVQLAFTGGGKAIDQNGALSYVGAQPFGKWLLLLLALGLIGYSLWGFIRALLDPLGRGSESKGLLARFGYLMSGISYGALALVAFYFATGFGSAASGKPQDISAQLMSKPFGPWLVGIVGLIWIGVALTQAYTAWKPDFTKDFKKGSFDANELLWAKRLGQFGYAARGVLFALIGWFMIRSALTVNPKQAVGLDGALLKLAQQPFGEFLLAVVALGVVSFGIFSILCARWMDVSPSSAHSSKARA